MRITTLSYAFVFGLGAFNDRGCCTWHAFLFDFLWLSTSFIPITLLLLHLLVLIASYCSFYHIAQQFQSLTRTGRLWTFSFLRCCLLSEVFNWHGLYHLFLWPTDCVSPIWPLPLVSHNPSHCISHKTVLVFWTDRFQSSHCFYFQLFTSYSFSFTSYIYVFLSRASRTISNRHQSCLQCQRWSRSALHSVDSFEI